MTNTTEQALVVEDEDLERVEWFYHFRSAVSSSGGTDDDMQIRLKKAKCLSSDETNMGISPSEI